MQGWIKLHRKFAEWEWKTSPKHVTIFLDLLLQANHKDKKYRGTDIGKGQLTTSYDAISKRTGTSIRNVRTVLKDLISTHEVTYQSMRHFSIITICNWCSYQVDDTISDRQVTSKRQASDKLVTTNKNDKKEKNVNNTYDFEAAYKLYPLKKGKSKGLQSCKSKIKSLEQYNQLLKAIKNYAKIRKGEDSKYSLHFSTFMNQWEDFTNIEIEIDPAAAFILKYAQKQGAEIGECELN